jgi:hypothetical protein
LFICFETVLRLGLNSGSSYFHLPKCRVGLQICTDMSSYVSLKFLLFICFNFILFHFTGYPGRPMVQASIDPLIQNVAGVFRVYRIQVELCVFSRDL